MFGSILFVLALAAPAIAQEFRSTITGRVLDSQGAVVPGASIVAVQVETAARHETVTANDGQYTLPFLPPAAYRVTVTAEGFKTYVREGLRLTTGERMGLDVTLEVGQVRETVTVSAESPLLTTTTANTGQVITARQIENMPMNGRTPLVLAQLAFGVVPSSDPRFYRPFDNAGPSEFSMGGAPARENELLIDGAPDTSRNNRVAYNPPVDAVEEVKVDTFQSDAAYGHTGGGTVNVVLKGGSNSLHGRAYLFNQVSNLAASQFFTNAAGQPKPTLRYNQWGINSGGPVIVPKLLDGRNRVFFYFTYEGIRDALPRPTFSTVPTAAERTGNLSALLALGANYQIFDPATGAREGARIRRQPFAGNLIPASRISPVSRNFLPFLPLSNTAGQRDGLDNFTTSATGERNFFNNELGRLDIVFSERHKMFYNFRYNERSGKGFNDLGYRVGEIAGSNGGRSRTNLGTMFDDVYTLSPSMVLNTRANWTRFTEGSTNFSDGFDIASIGFPGDLARHSQKRILPRITFDRFASLGDTGGTDNPQDIFQIFTNLTKILSKHSVKMGADLRMYREAVSSLGYTSGSYSFGSAWTRGPLDNSPAAPLGQDLASFLLGLPTGGFWDISASRINQAGYYALFLQDDFRVRPGLTLNLGLRYERDLPTTERYDRSVNGFDFAAPQRIDAAARSAYAAAPIPEIRSADFRAVGGVLHAGPGQRKLYETNSHYFSPRFGFAWTPPMLGGKTVVRGGFGVFLFALGTLGTNQLGYSQQTNLVASLDGNLTPYATLANPFPNGIEQPPGRGNGLATDLGKAITYYNPRPLNPYSARWSSSLQRELSRNLVLETGYMGNHAVHLDVTRQLNFAPEQYLSRLPTRDNDTINRLSALVPNPFQNLIPGTTLNGATVGRSQLLRPYPHFTGVTLQEDNDGNSYFHMFQTRVEKRLSHGLSLLANYQFSKLIERRSRLNDFSALEKRIAGEDRPQRIVGSFSYDVPFGKSRWYGGWNLNVIYTWQPGAPLTWGNLIYLGGPLNVEPRNVARAFDTARFNTNSAQQLASNVRFLPSRFGNARQDGANNFDYSVLKDTRLLEHLRLQYRFEVFNGMNHPTFNAPNLGAAASNFGAITQQANVSRRIQMALRMLW